MPKIENRFFLKEPQQIRYAELITQLTGAPVASGLSITQVADRVNLMNKLKKISKADDSFILSKEEIITIQEVIKKTSWLQAGQNVIDFDKYINSIK